MMTLPYHFDTSRQPKLVCAITALSGFFIAPVMAFIITSTAPQSLMIIMPALVMIVFGDIGVALFLFRRMGGCTGTLRERDISVQAASLFGIASSCPSGNFALNQFRCLQFRQQGRFFKMTLIGKDTTPDITFFSGSDIQAKPLLETLRTTLNLPLETA